MSIYATQWILKFPAFGDAHSTCEWVEVIGQGVPAHIGTPTEGYGYEAGDPYAGFLPPAIPVSDDETTAALRAIVIVREIRRRSGRSTSRRFSSCPARSIPRYRSRSFTIASATRFAETDRASWRK